MTQQPAVKVREKKHDLAVGTQSHRFFLAFSVVEMPMAIATGEW